MTDWVRLWHDMPTDPKWRVVAKKSGQPLASVIAVFTLMLTNASGNAADRGKLANWDHEDVAAALDMEAEDVAAIVSAMQGKVLDGERLSGWERRQPKREDNSAGRVTAHREAKRAEEAVKRAVTQRNAPETETETDLEADASKVSVVAAKPANPDWPRDGFERFYGLYPRKQAKQAAEKAYRKAERTAGLTFAALMAALGRYVDSDPDPNFIPHPATWLNAGRWDDEPIPLRPRTGGQNGNDVVSAGARVLERIREAERLRPELRGSGGNADVRLLASDGRS